MTVTASGLCISNVVVSSMLHVSRISSATMMNTTMPKMSLPSNFLFSGVIHYYNKNCGKCAVSESQHLKTFMSIKKSRGLRA